MNAPEVLEAVRHLSVTLTDVQQAVQHVVLADQNLADFRLEIGESALQLAGIIHGSPELSALRAACQPGVAPGNSRRVTRARQSRTRKCD